MKTVPSPPSAHRFAPPLAAAALLAAVVSGCAGLRGAVPYPSASIHDVSVTGITLSFLDIRFDVEIENPYRTSLPVLGMRYALSSNQKLFLEGAIEESHVIPAGESRVVPMPVRVPFRKLYEVGVSIEPGGSLPYRADLGLEIKTPVVGSIELPLAAEGSLSIPSLH
jgi:LEA14-like dessication related protein